MNWDQIGSFRDARDAFRAALNARQGIAEGPRYCECAEPDLSTGGLMCLHCQLRNRDQEVAAVHRIVDAHAFEPGQLGGLMCAVCTQLESDHRHHGVPAIGRTSWGTVVHGRGTA